MYLHIGNNIIIKKEDIVGIFELDGKMTTKLTKDFLNNLQKEGKLESDGEDLPKSFIITSEKKVYFSHISVSSLMKRCDLPF